MLTPFRAVYKLTYNIIAQLADSLGVNWEPSAVQFQNKRKQQQHFASLLAEKREHAHTDTHPHRRNRAAAHTDTHQRRPLEIDQAASIERQHIE